MEETTKKLLENTLKKEKFTVPVEVDFFKTMGAFFIR